ncbi:hypothetical protein [Saccharothrix stipae]
MDQPEVGEPEDGEPSAHSRGPGPSEAPDQAPGNPGWIRALAETTAAQREPFAAGVERLPGLDPVYWHGGARERFARSRDGLTEQWRFALDTHDEVLRRVEGHNSFVHELQHLWEADRGDPVALRHTAEVHRAAAADLAAMLLERAARLDAVAPGQAPEPPATVSVGPDPTGPRQSTGPGRTGADPAKSEPAPNPEPVPEPNPDPVPEAAARPEPRVSGDDVTANGHPGEHVPPVAAPLDGNPDEPPTTPAQRYLLTEKLGEQLVLGQRQYRIRWEAGR